MRYSQFSNFILYRSVGRIQIIRDIDKQDNNEQRDDNDNNNDNAV